MQEVKFLSLFGDCLDKNLHSVFEYANITDISVDIENRTLDMSVRFSRFTAKKGYCRGKQLNKSLYAP